MNETAANPQPQPPPDAEPAIRRRMLKQRVGVALVLGLIVAGCVVVYVVPPDENNTLFPRCTLYRLTGLHCPGCGGTRCVYSLMHGDVLQAAADNLYFLVALPFLLWWGCRGVWATVVGKRFAPPAYRPWLYTFIWVSLIAFAVLRNVPVEPFSWLAPHKLEGEEKAGSVTYPDTVGRGWQ